MPRPVAPWTWRRALRDHGPRSQGLLLTLYTIGTYMDRDGIAWPSQELIAAGARASVRTVQRHIAIAERTGWLGVQLAGRGGQGWRHNAYRAAVPDDVPLDDLEEGIADAITAQNGGIETPERHDTIVSSPSAKGHDTIVSARTRTDQERDDNRHQNVTTKAAKRDDNRSTTSRHNSVVLTPALNSHRTPAQEEAHSFECARASASAREEPRPGPKPTKPFPASADSESTKKVLHEGVQALGKRTGSTLRRISDDQLKKQLQKLADAGMTSVAEASRVLGAAYLDVGVDRLWRVIEQQRAKRSREVVV